MALPVAGVADRHGRDGLRQVRLYHSLWPLQGSNRVRPRMLFSVGPIALKHCSATDDGVCGAVEFITPTTCGDLKVAAQAGVAAYERGGSGLLAAARIYDDVDV